MIQLKSQREIEIMAAGGRILAETVKLMEQSVKPGMTTAQLDTHCGRFHQESSGCCAFVQGIV